MAFTLVRHCTALRVFANFPTRSIPTASTSSLLASRPLLNPTPGHAVRSYAKKSKKGKNNKDDDDDEGTTVIKTKGKGSAKNSVSMSSSKKSKGDLVAGEEPIDLGDVDAVEAHDEALVEKMKLKMEKSVSWCRGVVYDGVERGSGRVSPAILDSVRVTVPDYPAPEPLVNVASVTVKQNALWVEVYDADTLKHVESAIHKANLPGISPVKHDNLTLRIPVSRPTADTRTAIIKHISEAAEQAKQQVRIARTDALKGLKSKDAKKSPSGKEAQTLTDNFGVEIDGLVATAKKELAKA